MDLEEAQRLARRRLVELFPALKGHEDPLVTLEEVAALHDVTYATTLQWRQRSKPDYEGPGKLGKEFPGSVPTHRRNERLWYLSAVIDWSYEVGKWPHAIGRPSSRGPRPEAAGRHRG